MSARPVSFATLKTYTTRRDTTPFSASVYNPWKSWGELLVSKPTGFDPVEA